MNTRFSPLTYFQLLFALAFSASVKSMDSVPPFVDHPVVYPVAETVPVESWDDAADDPAIWVNRTQPELSRVLGTDKQAGLGVYDLDGNLLQFLGYGRLNNVDIREGFVTGYGPVTVAAATRRDDNTVVLFEIDESTGEVHAKTSDGVATGLREIYGTCMAATSDRIWVFVNDKDGHYQQWELAPGVHSLDAELVREFRLPSQPEGCVADDQTGWIYMGEEARGIWKLETDPAAGTDLQLVAEVGVESGLVADVEGLTIYATEERKYLIASSQGDFSYAVFDLNDKETYRGSFRIADRIDGSVDGSEETDGLDVVSAPLGDDYPRGLLVVQDGFNRLPVANQNFKYVSWQEIEMVLGL